MSYTKLGVDELREKARVIQQEAAELVKHGHTEEATNLNRKAVAMLEEAEQLQHSRPDERQTEIMEMNRLLERLRLEKQELKVVGGQSGRLEEIRHNMERVETELRELSHAPHDTDAAPHDETARRLEHMKIAVDHLRQAGLHDIAEHVVRRVEVTERELHQHHGHHEGEVLHEVMKQLDALRQEVGNLRRKVNALQ